MKRIGYSAAVSLALLLSACGGPGPAPTGAMTTPAYIRAVAYLQMQSRSNQPASRANAIEALQLAKDPRALDVIDVGLHDPEWVVRFAAGMAAGRRRAHSVAPALETLAVSDPNGSVRAAAIYALKRLDRAQHMSDLAILLNSPDATTRANTALVLGTLGDPGALPLLQSHRNESDIRARFELTAALARLGDESAQKVIVSGAINKFGDDQWNAMVVCADLPPQIATSPLIAGLQPIAPGTKVEPGVENLTTLRQLLAARSLAKQRNGEGRDVALANLKNPDPTLRALAILALGEMLTPAQVRGLTPYMEDPADAVKSAAAAAIVNIFVRSDE